jgi:hypothetical protein
MTEEEKVANGRRFLTKAAGWWTRYGPEDVPVEQFNYNVNAAADIPRGGRNNATLAQLRTGARYAQKSILARCAETGMQAPNFSEWIIK